MNNKKIADWLLIIGGLNWGLVGLGSFLDSNLNVVNLIFGEMNVVENLIYVVVGLAAVWALYTEVGSKR